MAFYEEVEDIMEVLEAGPYAKLPYVQDWFDKVEATSDEKELRRLVKKLDKFMAILSGDEDVPDDVTPEDINQALLTGTLGVGQSGVAVPGTPGRVAYPARRAHEPIPDQRRRGPDLPPRGDLREPTEREIRDALRMPTDFGYSGELPIGETWAIGPVIRTRDSSLLEQSNADALERELRSYAGFEGEWEIVHAGHWAVGWVDHLAFHAVETGLVHGSAANVIPTTIFQFLCKWFDSAEEDPVANPEDYESRLEILRLANIREAARQIDEADLDRLETPHWENQVEEWLEEHGSSNARRSLEDPENYSTPPDQVEAALRALGLFVSEPKFEIELRTTEDDPYEVLVTTRDRQAAIDDQSIEGSNWEAPHDMNEAYTIVQNTADLPDRLRAEGYIVDQSEWYWPGAAGPGQREMW